MINIKKYILISIAFILIFSLSSCAGIADYNENLTGGYQLFRTSAGNVSIINSDNTVIIDGNIYKYCFNDQFIAAQQIDIVIDGNSNTKNPKFYIIDISKNTVTKSMSQSEYENYISKNDIKNMCDWKETTLS